MHKDLITETHDILDSLGYTKDNIAWIGGNDFIVPPENFWNAKNQTYDNGFGWQEVAPDLTIMLKDGTWLVRAEYDGSEWWEHRKPPVMPLEIRAVHNFIGQRYESSLAEIVEKD